MKKKEMVNGVYMGEGRMIERCKPTEHDFMIMKGWIFSSKIICRKCGEVRNI